MLPMGSSIVRHDRGAASGVFFAAKRQSQGNVSGFIWEDAAVELTHAAREQACGEPAGWRPAQDDN